MGNPLMSFLWDKLGNCSICIRKAFQAAAAGWSLTLVFALLGWSQLVVLTTLGAITLTTLWLAHLLVHARKVIIVAESPDIIRSVLPVPGGQSVETVSRRAMLPLFVRALCAAAVMSATPAFAQQCTAGTGSCEQDGCPRCSRPCYVRGNTLSGCIRCRSCGSDCPNDSIC
jgi:hypothetical protein